MNLEKKIDLDLALVSWVCKVIHNFPPRKEKRGCNKTHCPRSYRKRRVEGKIFCVGSTAAEGLSGFLRSGFPAKPRPYSHTFHTWKHCIKLYHLSLIVLLSTFLWSHPTPPLRVGNSNFLEVSLNIFI